VGVGILTNEMPLLSTRLKLLTKQLAFGLDQNPPKHEVKRRAVEFIAEMLSSPEHEIKRLTSSGVGYFC